MPGMLALNQGATIRPRYVERTPPMWAVSETDMVALSIAAMVANVCFAIGSFCLGVTTSIIVSYAGVATAAMTEIGGFMLYKCTIVLGIAAVAFYGIGIYFHLKKGSLWKTIKSETRQLP
jgi:hypothetical protein